MEILLVLDDGLVVKQNSDRIALLIIIVVFPLFSLMPIEGLLCDLRFVRLEGSATQEA